MKIPKDKTINNLVASIRSLAFYAFFISFGILLSSSTLRSAGYPTPTPNCAATPTPTPSAMVDLPVCDSCEGTGGPNQYPDSDWVEIPTDFQAPDGAKLAWTIHPPPGNPENPPGVILVHGGSWYSGNAKQVGFVADDIAEAGYLVVAVEYELARCGYIPKQPCHQLDDSLITQYGDMATRQTNDVKAYVAALRASGLCDRNKIGVVGGSSGGSHALILALDKTPSGNNGAYWPFWGGVNGDTRVQCAASLSGIPDFSDRTPKPGILGPIDSDFILGTENYVNSADLGVLKSRSPIALVTSANTNPFVPLFLINSWFDSPPSYHQIVDMICALSAVGVSSSAYQTLTIPDSTQHSFHYWNSPDGITGKHISAHVIEFLDAHLK